jgi:hypothetical protein
MLGFMEGKRNATAVAAKDGRRVSIGTPTQTDVSRFAHTSTPRAGMPLAWTPPCTIAGVGLMTVGALLTIV